MEAYHKIKSVLAVVLFICLWLVLPVQAQGPAPREWVELPILVNIIDDSDDSNIEAAIERANEILEQAHIKLVVKVTKKMNVGNGDPNLTYVEGNTALRNGQRELDNWMRILGYGPRKGIKINVADDVWEEDPGTIGWCVHNIPVIAVETGDANTMGNTMAHETIHVLTVAEESEDPNNVMHQTASGTELTPEQIDEIFPDGRARGRRYFVRARVLPDEGRAIPSGKDWVVDAEGAVLDSFFDVNCPALGFDPCDAEFGYGDLREVGLYCDSPDEEGDTRLKIQLGGVFPATPFNALYMIDVDYKTCYGMIYGGKIQMHVSRQEGDPNLYTYANCQNWLWSYNQTLELLVHENHLFDIGEGPVLFNHSLEVSIPAGFFVTDLLLGCPEPPEAFYGVIRTQSSINDFRLSEYMEDDAEPFVFSRNNPCGAPTICFTSAGILGRGFTGEIGVEIDGVAVGTCVAEEDGTFMYLTDEMLELEAGLHSVIVKELDDEKETGAAHAIGYFTYCPEGEVVGDLDNDCDVDFYDFAFFADDWLKGTTPP